MPFDSVIDRLHALGRRKKLLSGAVGAARLAQLAVGLVILTFALDWLFHLPAGVRAVLTLASAGAIVAFFARALIRPLASRQTTDDLALLVERSDPALNDRLISALQLHRDLKSGTALESPALIQLTIDGAVAAVKDRDFRGAISFRPARRPFFAAALVAGAAVVGAIANTDNAKLWFERFLLFRDTPWPKLTNLEVTIVDQEKFSIVMENGRTVVNVPERTPLQVQVGAKGVVPSEVELITAPPESPDDTQIIAMGRAAGKNFFQHIFPPLSRSMIFYAVGGDDRDEAPVFEIRVARAPRVQRFWVDYEYPAYTGLKPRTLPDANISAPEGTKLTMHFNVNMPLGEFELAFEKGGQKVLKPTPDGAYVYDFVLEDRDFYTYRLVGHNGINSVDVPRYVLTAELDQPPRLQMDLPLDRNIICTPIALIPIRGRATDDYGVAQVAMRSSFGEEPPEETLFGGEDLLSPLGGKAVPFYHDLDLRRAAPGPASAPTSTTAPGEATEGGAKVGDKFQFKFLVTDNRSTVTQPEPHRQFGDYDYTVQVLAPADVERELAQRQSRTRDRVTEITQLAEARKQETEDVLEAITKGGSDPRAISDRLALIESGQTRVSSELSAVTRQFMRVFDGYLYNRLDAGNHLTEKLLSVLSGLYRTAGDADLFKLYGQALETVRPQAQDSTLMGRLTLILDIFVRSAAERSPEAARRLAQGNLLAGKPDCADVVRTAIEMQRLLIDDLHTLENRLEAWEDYLDVVQRVKDLIDLQQGIKKKAEKLTR